jgi:hypothetical protein
VAGGNLLAGGEQCDEHGGVDAWMRGCGKSSPSLTEASQASWGSVNGLVNGFGAAHL